MMSYWPWWAGAIALGTVTFGYWWTVGRTVGVSGAWDRVLNWSTERATERADATFDAGSFEAALAAATAEEFGDTIVAADSGSDGPPANSTSTLAPATPLPVSSQAVLLVSMFVGGLIAAVVSGRFELRTDMGEAFAEIVVDGWLMWPTLLLGGVAVGFGTRMSGGCSSGHGLSGCGRLQPASILATAVFFGTAVGMSFLVWKVI